MILKFFHNLVQQKRRKMLILVIFLTFAVFIRQGNSINLTYIVKSDGEWLHPSCLAEENERYSATGWIYPIPDSVDKLPNITTTFLPIIKSEFNCHFTHRSKCNKVWTIKNWDVDEKSARTFDLVTDQRWEDFPTIFTSEQERKQFKERYEIPPSFNVGLSLRATDGAELLICEGWNPSNYPCYHFDVSKKRIFLRKYTSFTESVNVTEGKLLDSYEAFSNILAHDEWRNFIVSFDEAHGILSLLDVSANRTVIQYGDKEFKPMYLFVSSVHPALWKVHQNQFVYTKTVQLSRLGPTLHVPSRDLCVSLYVSTCENCAMSFLIINPEGRKILKEVEPTGGKWQLIKLKQENVASDKITIYIETKFVNEAQNDTEGFWGVDDVRVCHENEVKVTALKVKNTYTADETEGISCQVVQHPKWRPTKLSYSNIEDYPKIESTSSSTSINLTWTESDDNRITYFITYTGNDICPSAPFNARRLKSNGFLIARHNDITIDNLVPYTTYNVTLSSIVHGVEKKLMIATQESEAPTPEELPKEIHVQVTDTTAHISWQKVDCTLLYGHVIYAITVNATKDNNTVQTDNTITINDLEPFTKYEATIATARSFENIQNATNLVNLTVNFQTKAGVASGVKNLEAYSTDKNSVSFRFELPDDVHGRPSLVQVTRCNPLLYKKCKSTIVEIRRCHLWQNKFCVEALNLIPNQRHTFKISIKNELTHSFGQEATVETFTIDKVPAPPTNVTYKMVDCGDTLDYCHLNITWQHPYNQNGTIEAFNIVLNSTDKEVSSNINQIVKVTNGSYTPTYEYQIKYVPFSAHYELYIQSMNEKYKSEFTNIHVKTSDIGEHIDQSPKLLSKSPVTFKLPPVDHRLRSYKMTVVAQSFDKETQVSSDIDKKIRDHLCHNFGDTWIAHPQFEVTNATSNITIDKLKPGTKYCVTFIVTNKYRKSEHDVVYYEKLQTPPASDKVNTKSSQFNYLYLLLLLLLLIPVGFFAYRYFKKPRPKRSKPKNEQEVKENVYESLPFEECEDNCVNNETYDHLIHK